MRCFLNAVSVTLAVVFTLSVGVAPQARAQAQLQGVRAAEQVAEAMHLSELLSIMAVESRTMGHDLDAGMLAGQGGAGWARIVDTIHDPARWETRLRDALARSLPDGQVAPVLAFLGSEQGRRIIALEISARRALLDEAVETAARERAGALRAEGDPLVERVDRFIAVNSLVDANVAGAMNANYAFLDALVETLGRDRAAALGFGDVLGDIAAQEPEIRAETVAWLHGFLTLAYAPLEPRDLEAYIAFSDSDAGQALNAALFNAFDGMFVETSRQTGAALGRMMMAEEL